MSKTQFVWFYIQREAIADEMRYSMRSVCQYFDGDAQLTVVGDRPPWYTGHYIPAERVSPPAEAKFHGLADTIHKLQIAVNHPEVQEQFVSMMDDHYFLRRVKLSTLCVPRVASVWRPKTHDWWNIAITRTMQELERRGLPTNLYETHLMHVFEKDKLRKLFDMFQLRNRLLLRNTLYGNVFRKSPKRCGSFVATPQTRQSVRQLDAIAKHSTVLNHASHCWDATMQAWLSGRLATPASVEAPQQAVFV